MKENASGEDAGSGDIPLPRSLTRCARSFGCGERCRLTNGAEIYFLVDARKKLNRDTIRPRQSRFSIGSAPLTSITKSDAQISGGETRQDYKDTRRFPLEAPSCALLFRPCRLPDTCPPFSLREAWRFLIAHAVGISARCRSFAPSWAVCTNPPFSPTAAPYPVTIVLSPTRKDTTKRHWQQPLVTGLAERDLSRCLQSS